MKNMKKILALVLSASLTAGMLVLPAAAAETAAPRVEVTTVDHKGRNTNLTEIGEVDWIYPGRSGSIADFEMQDRKADADGQPVDILQFHYMKDTNTWNHFWDVAGTSFSWSDGVNKGSSAGQSSYQDLLKQFYGTGNMTPETEVGWVIEVPAADEVQTLTFVTGAVWAGFDLEVYVNGDPDAAYTEAVDSDDSGSGFFWKHTVTVGANTSVEVRGRFREHEVGPDMITMAGAGLSRIPIDPDVDYVTLLQDSVDLANAWLAEDISGDVRDSLNAELDYAQPLAEDPDVTNVEAYSAYQFLKLALDAAEATPRGGDYAPDYAPDNTAIFGCAGDKNAPIAYMDGSFYLRGGNGTTVTFGVPDVDPADIDWSRAEGYLPCLVSAYSVGDIDYSVETFSDVVSIGGKDYEIAYARMTTVNNGESIKLLPVVSTALIPLNDEARSVKVVKPGETVVRDYAVYADSMGGRYTAPEDDAIAAAGSYDERYDSMRNAWQVRLEALPRFDLPAAYAPVTEAVKAAYIDMLIAADGSELHAGEGERDAYDEAEAVAMLTALVQLGDTDSFAAYAQEILDKAPTGAAAGRLAIPFAQYLQKTWDFLTVVDLFDDRGKTPGLKSCVHANTEDTAAVLAYAYLCEKLADEVGGSDYESELAWAGELAAALQGTDQFTGGADLLPGTNPWTAWLFGGDKAENIDDVYAGLAGDGFNLGSDAGLSNADNAGRFAAALLGEAYRDHAIQAYRWMIDNTMTAPYVWAETTMADGSGSGAAPYVAGEITAAQAVTDALIAEKADGTLVIGRGVSASFTAPGETFGVSNFLCNAGQRIGYTVESTPETATVTFTGGMIESPASIELAGLKDNIAYVTAGTFDAAAGIVTVPAGTRSVEIGFLSQGDAVAPVIEAIDAIGEVTAGSAPAIENARAKYDALNDGQKTLVTNYQTLLDAEKTYKVLTRPTSSGSSGGGSSGGSSSGSGSTANKPVTTTNDDGSKTVTKTDAKTGETVETTTAKDGTVTEKVTAKDGTVTETVTETDGKVTETVTDGKTGTVTETVKETDGTVVETVTEASGAVTETVTAPDGGAVKNAVIPGEAKTITVTTSEGKVAVNVSLPAELPEAPDFNDVAADHWAKKAVDTVSALGLFKGDENGSFALNTNVTRATIVTVLFRLSGDVTPGKAEFGDVAADSWYGDAVAWAGDNGIVSGVSAGQYAPDQEISREMLATILYRYAGLMKMDQSVDANGLGRFDDRGSVSSWAQDSMSWAVKNGLITGRADGLAPGGTATRAEVATILTRFINTMSR